jgi:hypothetical protein
MDSSKSERRKSKRIKGDAVVQFKGDNFLIYSNISNIGTEGLFVNTYYILDKDELVDLSFDLPRYAKRIDVKGRVIRQAEIEGGEGPVGLAIRFENISGEDLSLLQRFIQS